MIGVYIVDLKGSNGNYIHETVQAPDQASASVEALKLHPAARLLKVKTLRMSAQDLIAAEKKATAALMAEIKAQEKPRKNKPKG